MNLSTSQNNYKRLGASPKKQQQQMVPAFTSIMRTSNPKIVLGASPKIYQKLKVSPTANNKKRGPGIFKIKSKSSLMKKQQEEDDDDELSITSHFSTASNASSVILGKLFREDKSINSEDMSTAFCKRMPMSQRRSIRKSIRSESPSATRQLRSPATRRQRSSSLPSTLRRSPIAVGKSQRKLLRRGSRRRRTSSFDDQNSRTSSKGSKESAGRYSTRSEPIRRRSNSHDGSKSNILSSSSHVRSTTVRQRRRRSKCSTRSSFDAGHDSNTIMSDLSASVGSSAGFGSTSTSSQRLRRRKRSSRRGRSNSPSALRSYLESSSSSSQTASQSTKVSSVRNRHRRCKSGSNPEMMKQKQQQQHFVSPTNFEEALEMFAWMGSEDKKGPFQALAKAA